MFGLESPSLTWSFVRRFGHSTILKQVLTTVTFYKLVLSFHLYAFISHTKVTINQFSGYTESLDKKSDIVVPDDDHGLYAIDILDPSWVIKSYMYIFLTPVLC